MIRIPRLKEIRIRQEGARVLLILGGKCIADMPWRAADELARGITVKARAAEEFDRAEQLIADQALLLRAGAPFGLTNNPAIRAEAAKEAAWGSALRRYLPGGIKSKEQLGRPAVIRHPPRE